MKTAKLSLTKETVRTLDNLEVPAGVLVTYAPTCMYGTCLSCITHCASLQYTHCTCTSNLC